MSKLLVEDALWERVEPLLPVPKPRRFRYPGHKPLDNRAALTGILFILKTGLPWNDLPREMGCSSGAACGMVEDAKTLALRMAEKMSPTQRTRLTLLAVESVQGSVVTTPEKVVAQTTQAKSKERGRGR